MCLWMILIILINHSSREVNTEVVNLLGTYGQITSPGYPSNYPNNVNYTWIINTNDRRTNVTFNIQEMDIDAWSFNCEDYLEIAEVDPCCFRLFKRCGTFSGSFNARGRKIRVSFISDWKITRKGFNLYWKVFSTSKTSAMSLAPAVHSTLMATTVLQTTVDTNKIGTFRLTSTSAISTLTLETSTKVAPASLSDMLTTTLSKAFKLTTQPTPLGMSTQTERTTLFDMKASATSKVSKATKNILVFYSNQPRTTFKASPTLIYVTTPLHSFSQKLLNLMTRNAFNPTSNLIETLTTFYRKLAQATTTIRRLSKTPRTANGQTLTTPTRQPSKPLKITTGQPSKTLTTTTWQPSKTVTSITGQPSETLTTITGQPVTTQPSLTQEPSNSSEARTTGQQSTTYYIQGIYTKERTTSVIIISISSLAVSLLTLILCYVIYKRKRQTSSSSTTYIHLYECMQEASKQHDYMYKTSQTQLIQVKDDVRF